MEPQNKKRRLSLSLRSRRKLPLQDSNNRFAQPTSEENFLKAAESVEVHYTNHCLRATGISQMFTSGISETSCHRSLTALRAYEKTSEHQQQEAGRAIAALEQSTFDNEEKHEMGSRDADKNPEITAQSFPGAELNNFTISNSG